MKLPYNRRLHMDMVALQNLVTAAWAEWERARNVPIHGTAVPAESAPVLWFGPSAAYANSVVRVLTLGVNPGPLTFREDAPWANMPGLGALPIEDRPFAAACRQAYDEYPVNQQPHAAWFHRWNALIQPIGQSWGAEMAQGSPLHVDLSPIATSTVFTNLPKGFAADLRTHGMALLVPLLAVLKPHVTFASVSIPHFDAMRAPLGVRPHTHVPIDGVEAWICDWNGPGVLVWVRKTNFPPVAGGQEQRHQVGAFVQNWLNERQARPAPQEYVLAANVGPPQADADGQVHTVHDVVADMQAACPRGPNNQRAASFQAPHWIQHRGNGGWGWGKRWKFLTPDGQLAELSTQGSPQRVLEFLADWEAHGEQIAQGPWGRRAAKGTQHILFNVGNEMKHYSGLYFRWLD